MIPSRGRRPLPARLGARWSEDSAAHRRRRNRFAEDDARQRTGASPSAMLCACRSFSSLYRSRKPTKATGCSENARGTGAYHRCCLGTGRQQPVFVAEAAVLRWLRSGRARHHAAHSAARRRIGGESGAISDAIGVRAGGRIERARRAGWEECPLSRRRRSARHGRSRGWDHSSTGGP